MGGVACGGYAGEVAFEGAASGVELQRPCVLGLCQGRRGDDTWFLVPADGAVDLDDVAEPTAEQRADGHVECPPDDVEQRGAHRRGGERMREEPRLQIVQQAPPLERVSPGEHGFDPVGDAVVRRDPDENVRGRRAYDVAELERCGEACVERYRLHRADLHVA